MHLSGKSPGIWNFDFGEIVSIGHRLKRDNIQELLDKRLLIDEEIALGPEMWMEAMGCTLQLDVSLVNKEDEEEEQEKTKRQDCQMQDFVENFYFTAFRLSFHLCFILRCSWVLFFLHENKISPTTRSWELLSIQGFNFLHC